MIKTSIFKRHNYKTKIYQMKEPLMERDPVGKTKKKQRMCPSRRR